MAKIRDYAITISTTTTASLVCEMPTHVTGDLLLAFLNKDSTTGFAGTGWTMQQEQNSAGAHGAVWAKRAASASETITFTLTSETCLAVIVSVKNVNGSTVADAVSGSAKTGADDLTFPLNGATMTPSHNNCLIFDWLSTDIGVGPSALPGWVNIFTGDAGANSGCLSYTYQKTAASITHTGHWGGVTSTGADSRAFIIAVRDDGNETEVDPYVDRTTVGGSIVASIVGVTGEIDAGTWTSTLSLATVGAKSTSGDIVASVADSGYIPFWGSASFTPAASTTLLGGSQLDFTSAQNMQTGSPLLFGTWNFATPRDYVDLGKAVTGGLVLAIADASNDYKAWCIGGQFNKTTNPDKRNKFAIQVNQSTSTTYGASGTLNDVTKVLYLASGFYGAVAWRGSNLWLLTETILAGGSATTPLTFEQMEIAVNDGTGRIPIFDREGAAATIWTRIRVGGGDPVHYDIDAKTFQWPRVADAVDYFAFHVDINTVGIEFYGLASDTLHFTNSVFVSSSTYYWRFNASHSGSADIDFSGSRVINATVTLRSTSDLDGVSLQECPTFTQNSATLNNCAFLDTKVTSAAPADAALISNSTFTSSGTGHGIEIGGTAADMTLNSVTFTGYAVSDGSTGNEAIYVNIGSGSMSITIDGGSTPSIRTAVATVTVIAGAVSATVNVKNLDGDNIEGARVFVKAATGGPFPFDVTVTIANSDTTATVTHTAHAMATNDKVIISGASHNANNGIFTITKIDANSYSYTMGSAPGSNPTGTIKCTFVVLSGLTDASGNITMSRVFSSDQPIIGWGRKASGAPFYKQSAISASVDSGTGFSATALLTLDD